MPLAVRYVEPKNVCSTPLLNEKETRAGDALGAVTIRSLAGLIRQLSSLARHAEGVMGELVESLAACHERTTSLERRTTALKVEVLPKLDPDREVLEGFEIPHPDYQFKSDRTIDQRLLTQQHAPAGLMEQYNLAEKPPALDLFTCEWEDGRNAMHLYSHTDFFFQSWREGIQRETLRKMSQMDLLSPIHDGEVKRRVPKHKRALEQSTGSDKVSSFARPVRRTFSFSRRPRPQRYSFHGSTQSLQDLNFSSASSGRINRRSSPSFRSIRQRNPSSGPVRSPSLRNRPRRRPKLQSLNKATGALYEGQTLDLVVPITTLEESGEYEVNEPKQIKRRSSFRRSQSFRRSRSKSPAPPPIPTSSVFTDMHMYTVAEELARRESSKFSTLSKHHLDCLDLGSTAFEMRLAVDNRRKTSSTFNPPAGIRRRPVSSLDMHFTSKRGDSMTNRLSLRRYRSATTELKASTDLKLEKSATLSTTQGNEFTVKLRRHFGPAHGRPMSASFVEPPTVKMAQTTSRSSLRSHGGSLTDLMTYFESATNPAPPTNKIKPKRPAPPVPPSRKSSHPEGSESGPSTPRSSTIQSPLLIQRPPSQSSASSSDTLTSGIPNGRMTPRSHQESPIQQTCVSPPLVMNPILEEDSTPVGTNMTPNVTISSPVTPPKIRPPLLKQESLYISPRKQTLTAETIESQLNTRTLRASQILEAGGIRGGDLSSSRLDLLAAIRKGIQLNKVQKEEEQKETMSVNMPWDVAAILERRFALESYSDSESSESESNAEEWED